MSAYNLQRTLKGWRLTDNDLVYSVEGAHVDRGVIRAALSIHVHDGDGDALLYCDRVSLTSAQSRQRVIKALLAKNRTVDERPLLALHEACHSHPARRDNGEGDGGTTFSEKPPPRSLLQLLLTFNRWLLITDPGLLIVVVAAVLAHRLGFDPVWLLVVAPPGGTKSELLRALYGYPGVYPMSDLSARTFASGLDTPSGDPSLLARLTDEVLVLKDFTTVLQKPHEEMAAIFAQLREIYDGQFDRAWGTGRELHWRGRLGFLAGVTPIIDKHHAALSVLGERFVLLRSTMPDRHAMATKALSEAGNEETMRHELAEAMHGFLAARGSNRPGVPSEALGLLATVADFVTCARSGVVRDGYKRELEYAPEPEAPTRFAKVLLGLASGIALARDRVSVGDAELALVLRVALDCLPIIRRRVIDALVQGTIADADGALATSKIANAAQFSTPAIRRTLEDLQALGIVLCRKAERGSADTWLLHERWAAVFRKLADAADHLVFDGSEGGVSENSPPPSPPPNGTVHGGGDPVLVAVAAADRWSGRTEI